MDIPTILLSWVLSYLAGSIPVGLIVVWIAKGVDVRRVESGRTGGTNVMRAAGWFAGLVTAILDVTKGVASGWFVRWLVPESNPWVLVVAALLTVIGHNYSILLLQKRTDGKLQLRGGAGGATAFGGAIAIWAPSLWYILPAIVVIYLFIGYASVTTMSIAGLAALLFFVRAVFYQAPWQYILYGVLAFGVVVYALRPNIKRLREGTERLTGLRAKWAKKRASNPG